MGVVLRNKGSRWLELPELESSRQFGFEVMWFCEYRVLAERDTFRRMFERSMPFDSSSGLRTSCHLFGRTISLLSGFACTHQHDNSFHIRVYTKSKFESSSCVDYLLRGHIVAACGHSLVSA